MVVCRADRSIRGRLQRQLPARVYELVVSASRLMLNNEYSSDERIYTCLNVTSRWKNKRLLST